MKTKYEEILMIEETTRKPVTMKNVLSSSSVSENFTIEETVETTTSERVTESHDDMRTNGDIEDEDYKGEENEDLRSKYVKLIEHNSKLVDLLKTTMQIQTDMFRKLIHYVFPWKEASP